MVELYHTLQSNAIKNELLVNDIQIWHISRRFCIFSVFSVTYISPV